MKSKHDKKLSSTEIKGELWVVLCKVRGLAELVSMASGEPPMSEVAYKGLSYILLEIADQIDAITATRKWSQGSHSGGGLRRLKSQD